MKKTVFAIAALIVGNLITFSQTPENAPAEVVWEIKPLELPAENVELVSADGRKITASVLSKSDTGITIRNAEGKEIEIAWGKLNDATKIRLLGKAAPAPKASTLSREEIVQLAHRKAEDQIKKTKELQAAARAEAEVLMRTLDRPAIHQLLVNKDPKVATILESYTLGITLRNRRPSYANTLDFFDIAPMMNVKPKEEDEQVSLRPQLEKLGVVAREQEKNMCWIYATQHLAQCVFLAKGLTPPTIDELKRRITASGRNPNDPNGGSTWPQTVILNEIAEGKLKRLTIEHPMHSYVWQAEMIKHQIRNGRPCIISKVERIGNGSGKHAVVVVGFEVKNSKLYWETINSNNVAKDNGYEKMAAQSYYEGFSIWLE